MFNYGTQQNQNAKKQNWLVSVEPKNYMSIESSMTIKKRKKNTHKRCEGSQEPEFERSYKMFNDGHLQSQNAKNQNWLVLQKPKIYMSIKSSRTIKKRKKRRHRREVRKDKTQNLKGLTNVQWRSLTKPNAKNQNWLACKNKMRPQDQELSLTATVLQPHPLPVWLLLGSRAL